MDLSQHWILAPVIGEISDYQTAILCEPRDKSLPLTYLIKGPDDYIKETIVFVEINGPTRIVIQFPQISNKFSLEWYQGLHENTQQQIFKHEIIISNQPDRIIFVSCDLLEADTQPEHSMWTQMNEDILLDKQTCLIHIGDQAYMDKVFKDCLHLTQTQGKNDTTALQIIQAFGQRYADTWMPHHDILSRVTNYQLWDDHEIKNDVILTDQNISEDEKYVRDLAVQAYISYQESLHLHQNEIMSRFSWYKRMDDLLIIAIERTSRIIPVSEILQAINHQTESIITKRLILCFASAPIPPPQGIYGTLYRKIAGTSKFWSITDLSSLYQGLFDWLEIDPERELLVIGGDLHFGTYGVARRNKLSIPVIISSPITNQPTTDRWLASKGMKGTHSIDETITFNTVVSLARRCYAVVNLNTSPMRITMKYSTHKLPSNILKYLKTILSFR